jgi:phage anti-repressor protein
MNLAPETIFGLLTSTDDFPVDFDDAWGWIGYSRKDVAKSSLISAGFFAGTDFRISRNITGNSGRGRNPDSIRLTIDCFKSFAMMAGTEKGKEVRAYFLDCEKQLKAHHQKHQEAQKQRLLKLIVKDQADPWSKRFEDEFFDEAYRITGWKRPQKGHPPCMGGFINDTIYDQMPVGTSSQLRRVNPKNENGNRLRKHHQHLTETLGVPILATQKAATIAVMRLSPANRPDRFKANMVKACGPAIQLELLDSDNLNEVS